MLASFWVTVTFGTGGGTWLHLRGIKTAEIERKVRLLTMVQHLSRCHTFELETGYFMPRWVKPKHQVTDITLQPLDESRFGLVRANFPLVTSAFTSLVAISAFS